MRQRTWISFVQGHPLRNITRGCIATLMLTQAHAHPTDEAPARCVTPGEWQALAPGAAQVVANGDLLQRLAKQRVVMLGEDHDNREHHRWQLHTLIQLYTLQPKMALGFEAFPRRVQPVLDRWVAGELTEAAFLKAIDWKAIWTYDAELYLPMFHFARQYRIPLIALNIERSLISKTSEKGWANVPVTEREGLTEPAAADEKYVAMLREVFNQHRHAHGHGHEKSARAQDEDALQRFVQSQQVWDRAMAEALATASHRADVRIVVGVMGAGHLMHGYGVPHQLKHLGITDTMSLLPWDGAIACAELQQQVADAVFGLQRPDDDGAHAAIKPKLGVYLERTAQGVRVAKLTPKSVAIAAGLKSGDIVEQVAGQSVKQVEDVVSIVQATAPGTWLPLRIRRDKKAIDIIAKFPAHTQDPTP
ncbi:MAG: ChaN family lipoprotein [Gammaproteobacteria bacterium]|nr:ChaN family lipoprotein [Gammaproteobacteria bacterium]